MQERARVFKRELYYYFNNVILKKIVKIKIKNIDETIKYIIDNKCSVARFGDGELSLINNGEIGFQKADNRLRDRLKNILITNDSNIIICLPEPLRTTEDLNDKAKKFWNENLKTGRLSWIRNINLKKVYYNAHITRLYMDFKDKNECARRFTYIKEIWKERDIVIIEGKNSKLGVGNNLFENAKSINRIIAPDKNAFDKYDDILEEAKRINKENLILIALGPTATVLAYDLNKLGYQAIDIGHLDIEYEWFLRMCTDKENIFGKNTNEAKIEIIEDINESSEYNTQIISKII